MSILKNIQEQPQHIREIMFGLCVVTTVSLVGAVWFHSFQKDTYALLNPEEANTQKFLAQENQKSLFDNLSGTFSDLGAALSGILGSGGPADQKDIGVEKTSADKVYLLPLSEEK